MKHENLDKLSTLMNDVTSDDKIKKRMTITNSQYQEIYLRIFLDEINNNNGKPTPYDTFGDRLWTNLNKNANHFKDEADEFMETWSSWVHLYEYLKKQNKIK